MSIEAYIEDVLHKVRETIHTNPNVILILKLVDSHSGQLLQQFAVDDYNPNETLAQTLSSSQQEAQLLLSFNGDNITDTISIESFNSIDTEAISDVNPSCGSSTSSSITSSSDMDDNSTISDHESSIGENLSCLNLEISTPPHRRSSRQRKPIQYQSCIIPNENVIRRHQTAQHPVQR